MIILAVGFSCQAAGEPQQQNHDIPVAKPSVGAIRWDAWFADNQWQENLADERWRSRLPFYSRITAKGKVEIVSDSPQVMEREISYALMGGLDYWAFCYYHPSSWAGADSYNYGWRLFRQCSSRRGLKYCLILQGKWLGPPDEWAKTCALFCEMFREADYLKVCANRPLLFVFGCEDIEARFGSVGAGKAAFEALRIHAKDAGCDAPYIVAQVFSPQDGIRHMDAYGFDAIGAYSAPGWGEHKELPYRELAAANMRFTDALRETGRPVVPLVNAGWDARPRLVHERFAEAYKGPWYAQPTPEELAENTRAAVSWAIRNPQAAQANTVLIYAWNEHDEGGWLTPGIYEGDARLRSLAKVLKGHGAGDGR